jgi:hypothetical protein
LVFRGLKFLSDAEIGEKNSFRTGTKEIPDLTGQGNGFAAFIDRLRGP